MHRPICHGIQRKKCSHLTSNPAGDVPLSDRSQPQFSSSPAEHARVRACATPALAMAWTNAISFVPVIGILKNVRFVSLAKLGPVLVLQGRKSRIQLPVRQFHSFLTTFLALEPSETIGLKVLFIRLCPDILPCPFQPGEARAIRLGHWFGCLHTLDPRKEPISP